ncbi:MAG: tetratricopeptide repeat protein, partial [Pirellulaceae bacterium]|nr:tetratricopeptide repeat protein [Pirellulaceae bacterium]
MIRTMGISVRHALSVALLAGTALAATACDALKVSLQRHSEYHVQVARLYLETGLLERAVAEFEYALELSPDLVEAHIGIGNAFQEVGDYRRAHDSFSTAAHLEPNNFDACRGLGLTKQLLGMVKEAVTAYLRALAIRPDSFHVNEHLASAYLQLDRPGQAIVYAEQAVSLYDGDQGAWANLATSYRLDGEYEKAVDAYRRALELGDADAPLEPIVVGLADAHIRLGRFERAAVALRNQIRRHPSSLAHERLGYCQFKQHRFEAALTSYRAVLA